MAPKKLVERADLDALLRRLSQLGEVMPRSVAPSESPDFKILVEGKIIGIEITRSVYQEYARAEKLHEVVCPSSWISLTKLKDRGRRRSNKEILADMLSLFGPWEDAEASMLDWKEKIAASLRSKRLRYSQPVFQSFSENWLIIHDEPPLPPNDPFILDRARRHLYDIFFQGAGLKRDFDTVFVHSGRYVFRWRQRKLQFTYEKHDG